MEAGQESRLAKETRALVQDRNGAEGSPLLTGLHIHHSFN